MLALSETWGRADQPSVIDHVDGYTIWRTERPTSSKNGGGLCILYKDGLVAHQWTPSVPPELQYVEHERQWLILDCEGGRKCAFLHCYIACQSFDSDNFIQWNESLFHLITQEAVQLKRRGFMILAMGEFNTRVGIIPGLEGNTPDKNRNEPMFTSFLSEVNLFILNTLPTSKGLFTRFMTRNGMPHSSLLDYGLVDCDNVNSVTSFTIDEDARFACGSDHALLECEVALGPTSRIKWSYEEVLRYNFHENSDFSGYQRCLDQELSAIPLSNFANLESREMLPHITSCISSSAKRSFGLKIKRKKKNGSRLPKEIVSKIQTKNHFARTLNQALFTHTPQELRGLKEQLDTMKAGIKDSIADVRLRKRNRLRSRLLKADPTRKRFWKFLKNQTKVAGQITSLYKVHTHPFCHFIRTI